ncbi:MAG: flagellar hook-associated protein FlgK [Desulfoprunum sp.]|nr:flagellar hook-associated protein FlgK [Desulfoprunum sp.]
MAGLVNALNSARTSLEVNQKSIEVIGNNISNLNTEGYSRQSTTLTPYPAMNFGDFFIGQGVKVTDVQRDHDVFVTNQLQSKSVAFGLYNGQSRALTELERVFNVTEENIATEVDRFFDSWQELSASPSDLVLRDIVIQRGELLSTKFNNTVNDLNTVQENINDSIVSKVDDVNSKIREIADLNERVFNIEIHGQTANSARDRRDQLAKELAGSVGAQTYEDAKGMLAVQLPGGMPLVQGNQAMSIEAVTVSGNLELQLHAGGVTRTLGQQNLGGEFEGLVNMRDTFIPELKDDLDKLAYEISTQVNAQHRAGAGLDSVTNRDFFVEPLVVLDAARNMSVNSLLDSSQVAAAQAPPAPGPPAEVISTGDNRNALIISSIGETYLIGGIDNFDSYYGKMTSRVGVESNQNQLSLQGAEDAVVQLQNMRDGLAGVSLEEEMIDLIVYQRGFESSAKFLSTIDEMMNSLINMRN